MPARTVRKIQALVLGATGLFLLQKIWSGTLYFYINDRFLVLILLAALGFLVLAQILIVEMFPRSEGDGAPEDDLGIQEDEHHHLIHEHAHEHHATHLHKPKRFPWALLIVALPVLLGILIPTRPLGASAVANKGLRVSSPLHADQLDNRLLLEVPPNNRTILDWLQLIGSEPDPVRLVGEPVDVVGFVYRDPRLPEGQFMVSRFALTCCVADAFAIGMIVDNSDTPVHPENTWVRVKGTLDLTEIEDQVMPVIRAILVQEVAEPSQPYLIP